MALACVRSCPTSRRTWAIPLLNPDRIAKANQMSVRSLQYLFKSADMSVSDYIWTSRLERCRKELEVAVGLKRTVTEIAMDAGFNSLSHFSSVFRKRYGVSPTSIRGSDARFSCGIAPIACIRNAVARTRK